MRPLKIKASGSPVTAANYQGLQEMTDLEINSYLSHVITQKFATDTDGTGTAELNINGTGTGIGSFADTERNDGIGHHPTAGAVTTTTYAFNQVTAAATESVTSRPVGMDGGIKEMSDAALDTDILDKVITDMVTESDYTTGQYSLSTSAPVGGTWTSRYTITDSAQGGNTSTYLWQKTAATSSPDNNLRTLALDGTDVAEQTDAEIQQMVPNFRNRIVSTGIGSYKVQAATPTATGTWVQMGSSFTNTQQEVAAENYTGGYTGNYAGAYSGTYGGAYSGAKTYSGAYSGSYTGNYAGSYVGAKTYSGAYSGSYSGGYAGNYVGTSAYAGNYSGSYQGNYTLYYSGYAHATYTGYYSGTYTGYYTGAKTYSGSYTGSYTGYFTGSYVGTGSYSGTYTGYYSGTYTGNYVGTSAYTGYYTGSYTGYYAGTYSGTYSGDTIQASKETVATIGLWLRTA